MKIAELFINLGVKGSDSSNKALKGVKSNLGEIKSMAFETKAAIAGVIYGLEKMMSASAQTGTNLTNFTALTGMSAKNLQQWQYAARQAGVSAEEMTGNLKGVQNTMTNMLLGKGAPEGMAMLANKVGFDPKKARDTLYVMQQLQKFAQQVPQDVGNAMLKSFGLTENAISAMRRNAFTGDALSKAPTYSDKEVSQLDKANIAWANLGAKIQMAFGHLTASHGLKVVNDISNITTEVIKLIGALTILAEKMDLFAGIGHVFAGIGNTIKLVNEVMDRAGGKASKKGDLLYTAPGQEAVPGFHDSPIGKFLSAASSKFSSRGNASSAVNSIPLPAIADPKVGGGQTIDVSQTLIFQHDGKDAKKTSDSVHKAVKDTFRQMSAQRQGS